MNEKKRIYLIAGEPSGDLLASRLMRSLDRKLDHEVEFFGVGGETMEQLNFKSLFDSSDLAVMGLAEVIPSIPRILKRIHQTVNDIIEKKPDIVITVDSWSFSARINKKLKSLNLGIPQVHYVAPQVWAWKKGRAKTCGKYIDRMFALLPYEPQYFLPYGLQIDFVGHPVVESGASKGQGQNFRKNNNLEKNVILCLLPGSRRSEIKYLMPVFEKTIMLLKKDFSNLKVILPTVVTVESSIKEITKKWSFPVQIVSGEKNRYDVFAASDVALAASGTVALELAMAKVPYTIAYKMNKISSFLAKRLVKGRFANLINILADKSIVKENLLENCQPEILYEEIKKLLLDKTYSENEVKQAYDVLKILGAENEETPSDKAAKIVIKMIEEK
ncbi:MAG: lipid-A-disaccharide synthase [Alphaproteobacteria bacterium]|nr:lipid-A-disaccharide synthase [Alphaproteobacteria bacterium]